jgi:GH18 family chitinase
MKQALTVLGLVTSLLVACGSPPPPEMVTPPAEKISVAATGGKRVIGYFTQWGIYGVNYQVTDIPADKITHINYAFSNIQNGQCVSSDTFADFDHTKGGIPADWNPGALRGNAKGFKILKERNPNLKVLISIGGWTYSKAFSDIAASDASRKSFVQSCVDLWIKGNFPGGAKGEGVFDGIDVDWEYPVKGGLPGNSNRPEDRQNYTLLMREFRNQLDAFGATTGKRYLLTIASGASPDIVANRQDSLALANTLDWINLMSYDYHGLWESSTNFHASLLRVDGDPMATDGFYSDAVVAKMLELGVPADKIVLGIGFYGRGWGNVPPANDGLFQSGTSIQGDRDDGQSGPTGVFTYKHIASNLEAGSRKNYHPQAKMAYIYNPNTKVWVSYDDPKSIADKAAYVKSKGMGGLMFWEFSQDGGVLLNAINANLGVDPPPPPPPTGSVCFFENANYQGASLCGSADTAWIGTAWNDRASSVKIGSGYRVSLFDDINYGGRTATVSADTANLSTLSFDNILSSYRVARVNTGDSTPPSVSLSSSSTGVTAAGSITLTASATDNVGVSRVEFYRGTTKLGEDLSAPYTQNLNLSSADNGTLTLSAKAFDAAGNTATSSVVTVTVNISGTTGNTPAWAANVAYKVNDRVSYAGKVYSCRQAHTSIVTWEPPNVPALWLEVGPDTGGSDTTPPTVSLTSSSTNVTSAGSITLTANASDNVGVTRVEFYRGATKLGEDPTSPYTQSLSLSSADNGTLALSAKAFDAAGNTVTSSVVNVTVSIGTVNPPPPPPPGGLAKHALVGYWHNFSNPSGPAFPLSQVSSDWDVIMIAFAENATGGNVTFTLDPGAGSEAQFIADVRAKQAQGKKVVLSLGGQNGSVSVGSQAEANNFATSLEAIIKKFGFDGIDVDLESGVSQNAPIQTYLPIGVKALKARIGSSFYLSMAPEWVYVEGGYTTYGSIWGAYIPIINALRNDLTLLHPQYYNNGSVYTPYAPNGLAAGSTDQLVATARMLIEGFPYGGNQFAGLRPDQVGFGVPSGPSSAGSGFTTTTNVNNALDCLTRLVNCGSIRPNQAYPTFRGVMTWSINWDRHDGFNFSPSVASKLRSLP